MPQELFHTFLHTLFSVIFLFILTRIMGKKEISQLTFFDYVVGITIGSLSASLAIDSSVGYQKGIIALLTYTLFAIMLSYLSLKSYTARKILNSQPTTLIKDGQIIEKGLSSAKMNVSDLLAECRAKKIFNIAQIKLATLETSGKLSILLKSDYQPVTKGDMKVPLTSESIAINLIIDGKTIDKNLAYIGKDTNWLQKQLTNANIQNQSEIILAFVDENLNFQYYLKNDSSIPTPIF